MSAPVSRNSTSSQLLLVAQRHVRTDDAFKTGAAAGAKALDLGGIDAQHRGIELAPAQSDKVITVGSRRA